MSTTEHIHNLVAEYERVNAELNKQLSANGDEFFVGLFTKMFAEHAGLNKVCVVGWTPGFNDGDPCEHSYEIFVGAVTEYNGTQYVDYDEREEPAEFFGGYNEETESVDVTQNPNASCTTLKEVHASVDNFSDIIHRVYGTNFILKVTRGEDGTAEVECDEYDCGY